MQVFLLKCLLGEILENIFEGLLVLFVGTIVVLLVLGILAAIPTLIHKFFEKKLREVKPTPKLTHQVTESEVLKPEDIAVVTAASLAFIEHKSIEISKNPIIKQIPEIARILPLLGRIYEADVKISVGGREEIVNVRENPNGSLIVKYKGKPYKIQLQARSD